MDFNEKATQFLNYGGRKTKCQGKLSVRDNPEAYEVGLELDRTDNTYNLLYDSYNGAKGLMAVVGKGANTLMNAYTEDLFTKHMSMQGMMVSKTVEADGTVVMVAN